MSAQEAVTTFMSQHPEYSGENTLCAACGWNIARTKFMEGGMCLHRDGGEYDIVLHFARSNPRLHRECARCGYMWDEATVTPINDKKDHE